MVRLLILSEAIIGSNPIPVTRQEEKKIQMIKKLRN